MNDGTSNNAVWAHDGIVETPSWFGPSERALFGWLSYPADVRVRGAVVICPPVCEEGRAAHRTMRELAIRLAQEGYLSLRFDYDGTGDSAGDFNDPEWLDRWVSSVDAAVGFARAAGAEVVSLVGMRMGATIAAAAVARSTLPVQSLVLWDPCASGRTFLREQSLLHRTVFGAMLSDGSGSIETPGYVFGEAAVTALSGLRLDEVLQIDSSETAVTVLFRDDRAHSATLAEKFESAGFDVGEARGQDDIVDVTPVVAKVPHETLENVIRILDGPGGEDHSRAELRPLDRVICQRAEIQTQWGQVTESLVAIGRARLFGIETQPSSESKTTVVFLNALTECHIGPARMWPELAREWAARGSVAGVRFDVGGIGDSPDIAGRPRDRILLPGAIDDIDDAIARVEQQGRGAVLIGLSSGGYAALEGALQRVIVGSIAMNPAIDAVGLTFTLTDPVNLDERRKAIRQWPRPLTQLAIKHARVASALWWALQQVWPARAPMAVIAKLIGRGTKVLLVLADVDRPPFDHNWYWRLRLGALRRTGRFERLNPPALDHGLLIAGGRKALIADLTSYILRSYGSERVRILRAGSSR